MIVSILKIKHISYVMNSFFIENNNRENIYWLVNTNKQFSLNITQICGRILFETLFQYICIQLNY